MKKYYFAVIYRGEHGIENHEWTLYADNPETIADMGLSIMCNPITGNKGDILYWGVFDGSKAVSEHANEYVL